MKKAYKTQEIQKTFSKKRQIAVYFSDCKKEFSLTIAFRVLEIHSFSSITDGNNLTTIKSKCKL